MNQKKFTKQEERVIQKVVNTLLKDNLAAEDLVVINKTKNPTESLRVAWNDNSLTNIGYNTKKKHDDASWELYWTYVDMPAPENSISIPKKIPMEFIYKALSESGKVWKEMPYSDRDKLLWEAGIDTSKYRHEVNMESYRNMKNKVVDGLVLTGQERTDREWRESGDASWEAILSSRVDLVVY